MNVFYEEDGAFKAGHVLADQGTSMQVESASGKRTKVKSGNVLFDFAAPDAPTLMHDATTLAQTIDLAFLWECAPQAEFSFKDLASDYFGRSATPTESAALVTRLHSAPMYFYRKGRGQYRAAPPDALKAALAGQERKQREAVLQTEYRDALVAGTLPDAIAREARQLLVKPDKNRAEYKALVEAAVARKTTPERLLLDVGALASAADLHRERFLFAQFPAGTGFPEVGIPAVGELPLANVAAFSIDDSETTEIDDALSVTAIGERAWRIGVHIAAPGLVVARGDPIDTIARERYSTVYSPGEKITMLPDAVVEAFTLAAGRAAPALSLYVEAFEGDDGWRTGESVTRVERVPIAENLRHDRLDGVVTPDTLANGGDFAFSKELSVLWRFAGWLNARRQDARVASGLKPESRQRPDYHFRVVADGDDQRIVIEERKRDAPLDTIVAELMILANSTWGKLLAERRTAGIYRAQSGAFGPAGRVKMVTHPAPHVGLGVAQYAWSTSPLRRYVDLVNQRQLVACVTDATPPFAPKEADLFAVVSGFDAAYGAYADYQAKMERYWCLRWLAQEKVATTEARATGRDDHAMLVDIPLLVRVPGMAVTGSPAASAATNNVARGQRVEVDVLATDLVDLSIQCRLAAIIEEVDEIDFDEEAEDGEVGTNPADAETAAAEVTVDAATQAVPPEPLPAAAAA